MKIGSDTFILGFSGTELALFFGQKSYQIHVRIEKMNSSKEKKLKDKTAITYDSPLCDVAPMSTVSGYLGKRIVRWLYGTGAISPTVATGDLTPQLPVGLHKEIPMCFTPSEIKLCTLQRFKNKFEQRTGSLKFPGTSLHTKDLMMKDYQKKEEAKQLSRCSQKIIAHLGSFESESLVILN